MDKLQKLSFPIAAALVIAALGVKMARPEWQLYANGAVILGGIFFLISLYFERQSLKTFFSARSTRYGFNSLVMVILVLAIVCVVNWIAAQHAIKYDTTKNKQFSLSSLTVNAVKNLKKPVKITSFFSYSGEDDGSRQKMKTLLDDYSSHSQLLQVKLVDPLKNMPLVRQYNVEHDKTTVVESGTQKQTVTTTEEEDLTNAILKVSSNKQVKIYFMQGHGEPGIADTDNPGLSGVVDQLRKSNYQIEEIKDFAAKPKVPDDCTALVLASPKVQMLDHEIKGIQDYLSAGGRAIVMDGPRSDASLTKVIAPYKVQPDDNVVVDENCNFPLAGPVVPCGVPQTGTPVTREFDNRSIVFFPEARSLSYTEDPTGKVSFTPVAQSTENAWGETDKEKAVFDQGKDKKGPLTLALLVTKSADAKTKRNPDTRLAIFGDVSFVQNQFVSWSPWNYQLFSNTLAWLTEQENLIHLPPRNARNDVMTLSSTQLTYIWVSLVVVLPLIVLGSGIGMWRRRKKL